MRSDPRGPPSIVQILLAGSSGFLGTALTEALRARVTPSRRWSASRLGADESTWDPYAGVYDRAVVEAADVVVNLAGSPTAGNPHSRSGRASSGRAG